MAGGEVCICVSGGGEVLTTIAALLHSREITTVGKIMCMTIIQYTKYEKDF